MQDTAATTAKAATLPRTHTPPCANHKRQCAPHLQDEQATCMPAARSQLAAIVWLQPGAKARAHARCTLTCTSMPQRTGGMRAGAPRPRQSGHYRTGPRWRRGWLSPACSKTACPPPRPRPARTPQGEKHPPHHLRASTAPRPLGDCRSVHTPRRRPRQVGRRQARKGPGCRAPAHVTSPRPARPVAAPMRKTKVVQALATAQ